MRKKVRYSYKLQGKKIRKLRKELRLTQAKLASLIGVRRSYIAGIENGHFKLSHRITYALSDIFTVPITELDPNIITQIPEKTGREFLGK